jgi:hypothetical protein
MSNDQMSTIQIVVMNMYVGRPQQLTFPNLT